MIPSTTGCTTPPTSPSCAGATGSFVLPATVLFLGWFLLYVVMSNWAGDFMGHKLVGNINVALVFGLLQFVTTFLIAYVYSRYSTARLDPLGERLNALYEEGKR